MFSMVDWNYIVVPRGTFTYSNMYKVDTYNHDEPTNQPFLIINSRVTC